jgi:hypothetical protein
MASFSDTIRLTVSIIDGSNSKSPFKSLRDDIDKAEGSFGKLKAAGSGVFDVIQKNAAGFAIGAGAALIGFGVKAVSSFENLTLGAGQLRDALGLTAEQASRLQEVAGDLGIPISAIESAIGRMNKTAGSTPGVFAQLGVQIAKTKDGAYDANGTFLNVIDALHKMPDASARAAAGAKLFGKGWQDVAQLVSLGADGLKKKLADVESQKVVNDDEIAAGREFKASLDNLKDSAEDLALTAGKTLIPALARIVELAARIAGPFAAAVDKVAAFNEMTATASAKGQESGSSFWDQFVGGLASAANNRKAVPFFRKTIGSLFQSSDVKASLADLSAAGKGVDETFQDLIRTSAKSAEATGKQELAAHKAAVAHYNWKTSLDETGKSLAAWADAQANAIEAAQEYKDTISSTDWGAASLKGASSAMDDYTKSLFAADNQIQAEEEAFANLTQSVKENGTSFDVHTAKGRKNQDALESLAGTLDHDLAQAYKDSGGNINTFMGKGAALEQQVRDRLIPIFGKNKDKIDAVISSLGLMPAQVKTRYDLSGTEEARIKIGLLQGAISNMPKDVQQRIHQAILTGDWQGALNLMQSEINHSGGLTVRVNAVAGNTTAARAALGASFGARPSVARAGGGPVKKGEPYWVGEQGPEPFIPDQNGTIVPHGAATGRGAAVPVINYYLTVNAGLGTNPAALERAVMDAFAAHTRRNGGAQTRRMLGLPA